MFIRSILSIANNKSNLRSQFTSTHNCENINNRSINLNYIQYNIFSYLFHANFQTIPFLFVLMTRKTKKSYLHLFKYIKDNIFDMTCFSFTTDYERAMRKALRSIYPDSKFVHCWFHFCQAAKKRAAQTPQLIPFIHNNVEAAEIYYKLLSLPLLPAHHIKNEFQKLKFIARAKYRAVFADFVSYYERQWINRVYRGNCD